MAANLRANAVTEAAADGAVHEAILRLLQDKWSPDGRLRAIRVGSADVEVRIKDEEWKVNPNDAKLPVLQALFGHLGVDAAKGTALAHAIVDWHSAGAAPRPAGPRPTRNRGAGTTPAAGNRVFDSLDEIGLVVGMTPALLARMRPYLSIYQEGDVFEADDSAPPRFDGALEERQRRLASWLDRSNHVGHDRSNGNRREGRSIHARGRGSSASGSQPGSGALSNPHLGHAVGVIRWMSR